MPFDLKTTHKRFSITNLCIHPSILTYTIMYGCYKKFKTNLLKILKGFKRYRSIITTETLILGLDGNYTDIFSKESNEVIIR